MAGRGPAPKAPEQRRRANAPTAGEWIELPASAGTKPPALPKRPKGFAWSPRTKQAWRAWWGDPVSSQWSDGDRDLVYHLLYVHESWVREPTVSAAAEIRQLRDNLGLSPKGRQDRRWRIAPVADVAELNKAREEKTAARRRREIRAVDPAAVKA
jgi:hypothetical protein